MRTSVRHLLLALAATLVSVDALAQSTVVYHLHKESNPDRPGLRELRVAGPDAAVTPLRSGDWKNIPITGTTVFAQFATPIGVPGVGGQLPAGSTFSASVWMRKTSNWGTVYPYVNFRKWDGNVTTTDACGVTGTTALTATLTKYVLSCTTASAFPMLTTDRYSFDVGMTFVTPPGNHSMQLELDIEGTLNGNYDSTITVPLPLTPAITSLTPAAGSTGQSVVIGGANFGTAQGSSTVRFNGTAAAVSTWSATSIATTVPAGASSGPVVVTVNGQASNGVVFTVVAPPAITSLNPASGIVGQTVTIAGANFGATQASSTVRFNGVAASASAWSNTSITTMVPAGATSGPVVVTVNGQDSNGVPFTVIPPPSVTTLTPAAARVGDAVSIAGADFGAAQGTSTVRFNGTLAAVTSWSDTTIVAPVPANATTGPLTVTVNGQTSAGVLFTVLAPPHITQALPSSASFGQGVTLKGSGFGLQQGSSTVTFNGTIAAVTAWSDTTIDTIVPAAATSGPLVVTVGGTPSNGAAFTVLQPPVLDSLDPASGSAGDTVTLRGANLGPGTPSVTFNGIPALVSSAATTAVAAIVPGGVTSGNVVLTVNGLASNGLAFTVNEPQAATLTVNVFTLDPAAPDGIGPPAGAGVYVSVDGSDVGRTVADGTLTVQVAPGDRQVRATVPSRSAGTATVTLAAGGSASVSIVLDDENDVTEATPLIVAEAADGIVPATSETFTLDFMRPTGRVPLTRISQVEMLDHDGDVEYELGWMFTLSNGRIVASDPEQVFIWVPTIEPAVLRVHAVDADGFTHAGTVRFSVGHYPLHLTLAAPPSNPALNVANVEVTISVVGTATTFRRTSDVNGQIELPSMPFSSVTLDAVAQAGGRFYYGQGSVRVTEETSVTLTMRNVTDVIEGVPPLQAQPGGGGAFSASATVSSASAARGDAALNAMREERAQVATSQPSSRISASPALAASAAGTDPPVSISLTSDGMDETVERNATLPVPMGTKTVTLTYTVNSLEYPEWVQKQSPFDDLWSVTIFGPGGQQLFRTLRNVNSQQAGDPSWQVGGSTGELQEDIDVETLAANGDIELVLFGTAMNVRDALFDTSVNAQLGAQPKLTINKAEQEKLTVRTNNDHTYFSIPRPSAKNHFERWFTLTMSKPKEATINNVTVTLKDGAGATLQTLLTDEAPGDNVKLVNNGEQIRVRVSLSGMSSSVPSTPPSTHFVKYEFKVKGTLDGNALDSDPKSSGDMTALWRMPDGFDRYGQSVADLGGDDWASKGAYKWLDDHKTLISSINDVSGEHGRNIGHDSHATGIDIDIFHFHSFTGTTGPNKTGTAEYNALRDKVLLALNGDEPAKTAVTSWVAASRTGLEALLALTDVSRLYYAEGSLYPEQPPPGGLQLPAGWAADLLKNGKLTVGTKTVDTGKGTWAQANARITYNAEHNNHIHIALDGTKLPK